MKKAVGLSVALVLVAMAIAGAVQASTFEVDVDANGSVYFGLVGVDINEGTITSTAPDTVLGGRIDNLNFAGDFVVMMESANSFTMDRIVVVNNGYAGFDQIYVGSEPVGSFGTTVQSDGIGVLWNFGPSTGALAGGDYMIYQYAQRFDPPLRAGAYLQYSGPEGYGFSAMDVQLSEEWKLYPAYTISDWTESAPEAFGLDPEDYNGIRVVDVDSNYGFFVDILTLWKALGLTVQMDYNIETFFPENQE